MLLEANYVPGPCQELYFYAVSPLSLIITHWGLLCYYPLWQTAKNRFFGTILCTKKPPDFVPHPLNRWSLFLHPLNLILTALANGALANTVQAVVSKVLVHQGLPSLAALNHFPAIWTITDEPAGGWETMWSKIKLSQPSQLRPQV